ncbi:NADH-dependent flavin oxidoreductase [Salmonella enterica]|nr:NADH:flavin oxidoreductase [Salmonella enterica subsp. enterica]EDS5938858.1 NADH-dependent flavin oxidoreductase [Salmonella enterica subsp. enterica serovar Java]EIF7528989.1 NADH-dependent flavin oxidoreductase [Salmonella enterica]EGF4865410.1 NADH-dependent flavin oxidoreductase [Salmonella enterica subsp. enterica]EHK8205418.1 NADH-dependent flavin oxidoreductase [Salmonella enterica subsp. enterica]
MTDLLTQAFTFKNGLRMRNRVVMAPMTTWSANDDETISDEEVNYYRARATGVGLVITGCAHVQRNGVGFTNEFAAYDDRFIPSLRKLADAAKSGGALAILQLFHAGNKAVPELIPGGEIVSASALAAPAGPFNRGEQASRALGHDEISGVIHDFGEATRRAIEAGFDGVELHGAHGFLIQNFFSPWFNQRTDEWGGSLANRMRFPLEVVREVRRVIETHAGKPFLLGYRLSPEESGDGGLRINDSQALAGQLEKETLIDYLHISLHDVLTDRPQGSEGKDTILARFVEQFNGRLPLLAAGKITSSQAAQQSLDAGLSLVALGRTIVMNPNWMELVQAGHEDKVKNTLTLSQRSDELAIPEKLWHVIQKTPGWFPT